MYQWQQSPDWSEISNDNKNIKSSDVIIIALCTQHEWSFTIWWVIISLGFYHSELRYSFPFHFYPTKKKVILAVCQLLIKLSPFHNMILNMPHTYTFLKATSNIPLTWTQQKYTLPDDIMEILKLQGTVSNKSYLFYCI